MKVRIIKQCDGPGPPGERQALFGGQVYDLPMGHAEALIDEGLAVAVEAKAVDGPPENKAMKPRRTKSRRKGG